MRPYLPFREPLLSLRDVADAVAAIKDFTHGMNSEAFRSDPRTVAAVERKLLVISEAAIRLGDQAEVLCPGLPWRDIRGIGNWLRHQYDRVDVDSIWKPSPTICQNWKALSSRRCRIPRLEPTESRQDTSQGDAWELSTPSTVHTTPPMRPLQTPHARMQMAPGFVQRAAVNPARSGRTQR